MLCPECGAECTRDEVDIGVGVLGGPWGCPDCHWVEQEVYDDPTAAMLPPPDVDTSDEES